MKIQIDTKAKTIKLEDDINIKEFIEGLKKLFPKDEWKEYKLQTNTIIQNWRDPIIIYKDYPVWPYPIVTYDNNNTGRPVPSLPVVTCGVDIGTGMIAQDKTIYNIELVN